MPQRANQTEQKTQSRYQLISPRACDPVVLRALGRVIKATSRLEHQAIIDQSNNIAQRVSQKLEHGHWIQC